MRCALASASLLILLASFWFATSTAICASVAASHGAQPGGLVRLRAGWHGRTSEAGAGAGGRARARARRGLSTRPPAQPHLGLSLPFRVSPVFSATGSRRHRRVGRLGLGAPARALFGRRRIANGLRRSPRRRRGLAIRRAVGHHVPRALSDRPDRTPPRKIRPAGGRMSTPHKHTCVQNHFIRRLCKAFFAPRTIP
jgi:hypothetical protein